MRVAITFRGDEDKLERVYDAAQRPMPLENIFLVQN